MWKLPTCMQRQGKLQGARWLPFAILACIMWLPICMQSKAKCREQELESVVIIIIIVIIIIVFGKS
jgi:hypothetical protein